MGTPPTPKAAAAYQRNALAPGILAAIALIAGIALVGQDYYLAVRFIVAILAVIIGWFAIQAGQWWWAPVMLAVAVIWNPVYPVSIAGEWLVGAHIIGAAICLVAGAMIKFRRPVAP